LSRFGGLGGFELVVPPVADARGFVAGGGELAAGAAGWETTGAGFEIGIGAG
jgi:hypothetical protein